MSRIRSSRRWSRSTAMGTRVEMLERRRLLSASLATLVTFNNTNGANPYSGLIVDSKDNLYGTTYNGGAGSTGPFTGGTVFKITTGTDALTTLVNFNQSTFTNINGINPRGGLIADASGNLYGTTEWGGPSGGGTVFKIAADSDTFSTIVDFDGSNGARPFAGVIADASGNLYGTTVTDPPPANGYGTVFKVAGGTNTVTTLAQFNQNTGTNPQAALVADASGDLYGTAPNYGSIGGGTVFKLDAGTDTLTTLVNFNLTNGQSPVASLIADAAGNLYGTTEYGGSGLNGTVFKIAAGTDALTTLANFDISNGADPQAGLIADAAGNLYGTTYAGGSSGDGTVFEINAGTNALSTLVNFNGSNGANPCAGLVADSAGNLYGTTSIGGSSNAGTVFEITGSGFVVAPRPKITITAPPAQTTRAGTAANFSLGSFAQTNASAPYTDAINWGDGSTNTVLNLNSAGMIPAAVHSFAKAATFTVSEVVTDAVGDASNTATFNVVVSPAILPASNLAFTASPSGATAGKATSTVVVDVENSAGQVVTTDSSTVTLSNATGPSGAKLAGTVTVTANKGIATFSNLLLDTAGKYILKATDGSLASSNTSNFTVVPAAAAKIAFAQPPGNSMAGKAISPSVTVKVEDAFGNLETSDKSTVKVAVATGPTGGSLAGTTSVTATGGVATFGNLLLDIAGTYTLKATDGTLPAASPVAFTVAPATTAKVVFSTVPSKAVHNTAFALKVSIEDAFGNLVTTNTTKVTITIASGPSGGALSGTSSVFAVAGVAVFSTLKLSKTGKYTLKATDGSLTAAVSATVSVS